MVLIITLFYNADYTLNIRDFKKRKKAIWTRYQKLSSFPLLPKFQDTIEQMLRVNREDEETLDDLNGFLSDLVPALQYIPVSRQTNGDSTEVKPRRRYKKCFARRVYLVDFVMGRNQESTRINWKRTVAEWNRVHPSDIMSLPVLKAEYYKALRDPPITIMHLMYGVGHLIGRFEKVLDYDVPIGEWTQIGNEVWELSLKLIAFCTEIDSSGKLSNDVKRYCLTAWKQLIGVGCQ